MPIIRFWYVQGRGKTKHMLVGDPGEKTLCGAPYSLSFQLSRPKITAKRCKRCERLAGTLTTPKKREAVPKKLD